MTTDNKTYTAAEKKLLEKYSLEEINEFLDSLPIVKDPIYDALERGEIKPVAVGWQEFQKYLAKQRGRPKKEVKKEVINIAFEPDTIEYLRSTGRGWQTRLRKSVEASIAAGAL